MHRFRLSLLIFVSLAVSLRAADTDLLRQVARQWLTEHNRWAFTQRVREYEGGTLKQERLERFDPSQRATSRWRLISIDGRRPTAQEWADWTKRRNKVRTRKEKPFADYFDFDRARVVEETPALVRYELPLRNSAEWLFPIDKVALLVTISKTGPALEQVQARVAEPFRVVLGLARVLDIDFDVQMATPERPDPADAQPSGTARAVVSKLGRRVDYAWSDFKRVTPHAELPDE